MRRLVPYNITDQEGKPFVSVGVNGEQQVRRPTALVSKALEAPPWWEGWRHDGHAPSLQQVLVWKHHYQMLIR